MTIRSTIQLADDKGIVRHGGEWLVLWSDPDSLKTEAELAAGRRAAARRAEGERVVAAALRGIARKPELRVRFAGDAVLIEGQVCTLPALPLEFDPFQFDVARGRADALALMLRHHDPALHARLAPPSARARALFDVIEQARCEALGARELPGVLHNLIRGAGGTARSAWPAAGRARCTDSRARGVPDDRPRCADGEPGAVARRWRAGDVASLRPCSPGT